jgi:hypothetical protein
MLVLEFGPGYKGIVMLQGLEWQARRAPGNPNGSFTTTVLSGTGVWDHAAGGAGNARSDICLKVIRYLTVVQKSSQSSGNSDRKSLVVYKFGFLQQQQPFKLATEDRL